MTCYTSLSPHPPSFTKLPRADRHLFIYGLVILQKSPYVVVPYTPFENPRDAFSSPITILYTTLIESPVDTAPPEHSQTTIVFFCFAFAHTRTHSFSLLTHCIYMHIHIDNLLPLHKHISFPALERGIDLLYNRPGAVRIDLLVEQICLARNLR